MSTTTESPINTMSYLSNIIEYELQSIYHDPTWKPASINKKAVQYIVKYFVSFNTI